MLVNIGVVFSAVISSAFAIAVSENGNPTATIDIGIIEGVFTTLPKAPNSVNKFLGIPFAQSPPERFSPPVAPQKLSSPLNTTSFKDACIQQFVYPLIAAEFIDAVFNPYNPTESEDCLYLNVFAPNSPAPYGGRAVMFWIFGGSLQFGNAGQPPYDGSAFAAYQDVIIVTSNYRTNIFGFPNSPELPLTGNNLGFLDQRAGLEWVQRNIHAFGGDPAKVTIFGESAGALSIDVLLTSYTTENAPFRAAILESGQNSYRSFPSQPSTAQWDNLTATLGCDNSTSKLACVRAASVTDIKAIIDQNSLAFNPVPDNVTLVASPGLARANGNFARVPVMGGNNAQEGRIFEFGQNDIDSFLQSSFGAFIPNQIPKIKAAYPFGPKEELKTAYAAISQIVTDYLFQCPAALWANETVAQGVPTWRYYYNSTFSNIRMLKHIGVFHSSEIGIVFQTYPGGPVNALTSQPTGIIPTNVPPTTFEVQLSAFMNTVWANFAKNPTGGPGWPRVGSNDSSLGVLGGIESTKVTVINPAKLDSRCQLYTQAYIDFSGQLPGL